MYIQMTPYTAANNIKVIWLHFCALKLLIIPIALLKVISEDALNGSLNYELTCNL